MKIRRINCDALAGMEEFHKVIAKKMNFPAYYGANLDALLDVLGDVSEPTWLILRHFNAFEAQVGEKAGRLKKVLQNAAEENHYFHIKL